MLAADQQQARVDEAIAGIRNAYNNTGKIRKFVNVILLVPIIFSIYLAFPFYLTLVLIKSRFQSNENESKLLAWPKNIIRLLLNIIFGLPIAALLICAGLFALCLTLVNRALIAEVQQFFNMVQEAPEEERPIFMQNLVQNVVGDALAQTTHDSSAVASVNLSVDRLIEKYKGSLSSKEEFYAQLSEDNIDKIEEYINQLNGLAEGQKLHALKCLKFINETTGDSFKDSYSKLTLKQVAVLCWKACEDRNTGIEGQSVPLSDKDINDRKDMFINGLIDAATTYGTAGQSCPGGTYNKIIESLSGLHPSVVITLDEKEASQMIKETITQKFPHMAKENLGNLPDEQQKTIRDELPKISPETVRYIITARINLEQKCEQFKSRLNEDKKQEVLDECMSNLCYVELSAKESPSLNSVLSQPEVTTVESGISKK
jgi:hypothetical protein